MQHRQWSLSANIAARLGFFFAFIVLLLITATTSHATAIAPAPPIKPPLPPGHLVAALAPTQLVVGQRYNTLTWTDSLCTPTCPPTLTFNVYKGHAPGVCNFNGQTPPVPFATLVTLPTTANPFIDTTAVAGETDVYAVSAVQGGESNCTPELQLSVPSAPPSPSGVSGATH